MNSKTNNILINVLLHMAILFTILSLIFINFISKLEKQALESELSHLIKENISKEFNNLDSDTKAKLSKIIKESTPVLDHFIDLYSTPDKNVQTYNNWLFTAMYIVIGFLFLMVVISIIIPTYSVPVWSIIGENLGIFLAIGIFEGAFFYFIIQKYVPAEPSYLVNTMINTLKTKLK
jgi:hypothetical protein